MRKEIKILGAFAVVVIIAALIGAYYYRSSIQSERKPTDTKAPSSLVREDSPTIGAADAPVTLVEFLDPECETCAAFAPVIKKILNEYDGKVRLVVRYMPLHSNSLSAATFMEAAGEQGKYWQAQEILFQTQHEWGTIHGQKAGAPADINTLFKKYAMELGLDMNKMDSAFAENRYAAKIARDKRDGQSLGVTRTPTLFVNGRQLVRLKEEDLKSLINEELKK